MTQRQDEGKGAPTLPPIRTSIDEAKRDLDECGFARIAGAVTHEQLLGLRTRLERQAAGEETHGVRWSEGPNQRVWNLINKGEVFRDFATNPLLLTVMAHVLGPEFLLYSYTANIAFQGGKPMALHGDQQFRGLPNQTCSLLANGILMLVDFTPDNGATRLVPGTHRLGRWPGQNSSDVCEVAATGPAGTLLVYDGRLWHGTGANITASPRYALLAAYCRPFLRQQENFTVSVAPEVLTACSAELRALLGFQTWTGGGALGMVNGSLPGVISDRPTTFVTDLSP